MIGYNNVNFKFYSNIKQVLSLMIAHLMIIFKMLPTTLMIIETFGLELDFNP